MVCWSTDSLWKFIKKKVSNVNKLIFERHTTTIRWTVLSSELASGRMDKMTQDRISTSVLFMTVSVFELNWRNSYWKENQSVLGFLSTTAQCVFFSVPRPSPDFRVSPARLCRGRYGMISVLRSRCRDGGVQWKTCPCGTQDKPSSRLAVTRESSTSAVIHASEWKEAMQTDVLLLLTVWLRF